MRSWLTRRWPLRDSWKIVKRIERPPPRWAARFYRDVLRTDLGEQHALDVADERELPLLGRDVADRLLQREHRLRPLERVEEQAPVDDLEQVVRVLARPDLLRRDQVVLLDARVGGLRRERREAGEHRRADAVDVGPR